MGWSPGGSRKSWAPSLRMPLGQKGLSCGWWGLSPCLNAQRSWKKPVGIHMATNLLPSWVTSGMFHMTTGFARWSGSKGVRDGCRSAPCPGQRMGDWWGSIIPSRGSYLQSFMRTGLTSPWKPRPVMRKAQLPVTLNLTLHPPAHCLRPRVMLQSLLRGQSWMRPQIKQQCGWASCRFRSL